MLVTPRVDSKQKKWNRSCLPEMVDIKQKIGLEILPGNTLRWYIQRF